MPGARVFWMRITDEFILEVPAAMQGISFRAGRAEPESGNLRARNP